MDKKAVYEVIDSKASEFAALSDAIWDYAELAFTEHQSAEALCRQLEKEGFAVTRGVAGIETAFTARYGSGKPVIGILGEFDALSGLSQKAGCAGPGAALSRRRRSWLRTQYVRRGFHCRRRRRQEVPGGHRTQRYGGLLRHPR